MSTPDWTLDLYDGTTTVAFTSAPYGVRTFTPTPANQQVKKTDTPDGEEINQLSFPNVQQSFEIKIVETTAAAAIARIRTIETMLRQAERYQKKRVGAPVYLRWQESPADAQYRSEILYGRVEYDDRILGPLWRANAVLATIFIERRPYWEGPETELPLTSIHKTSETTATRTSATLSFTSGTKTIADSANGLGVFAVGDVIRATGAVNAGNNDIFNVLTVAAGALTVAETLVTEAAGANITLETVGVRIYNPAVVRTATTLAFVAATKKITDSANGLIDFKTGATLYVRGTASNDGTYTIATGGVAGEIVVNETLVNESAGSSFTLIGPAANYVQIAAADVAGDLPAPVRLELRNLYNNAQRAARFFVSHNLLSSPASLSHILEAEDGSGGTPTDSASASGGKYQALSWATTTETQLLEWTLSTALLNALGGNYVRLLFCYLSTPAYSDLWLRLKIKFELTTIWQGPEILAGSTYELQEMSALQLPPYLLGASNLYPLKLTLYGRRNAGGTHSLALDYIQLSPLDGWRTHKPKGYNLAYEARLVDDMISKPATLYTDGWDSELRVGNYIASGAPVMIWPNALQRLYFLHDHDSGGSNFLGRLGIKAYYRPRRMTL